MRQSQYFFLAVLVVLTTSVMIGCGGGGSSSSTPSTSTITVSPATLSMNFGQFVQLTPTVLDGNGAVISNLVPTYSSNDANVTVSTNGLVCAGTWDSLTTPVVCKVTNVAPASGAKITVTAGSLTATVPVSVHNRIARVMLTTNAGCTSQNATQQFTAHAFDSSTPAVDITAQAGTFFYSSSDTTVATIDAATGLATSKLPGSSTISASVNGVFSLPATFVACPPSSIILSPATFTGAAAASQQLTATVTDTAGNAITGLALTYSSSQPTVASVSTTGLITTVAAGNSGIIASCTPPTCNPGANVPVYSNLVSTTVTGTSATTVYVTGAKATSVIPIDTATNTAGTAITIPQINSVQPVINSFVIDRFGNTAFLGSDQGIIPLNITTNAFGTSINTPGVVLAVSPDGKKIITADQTPSAPHTYVIDTTNSSIIALAITTASTAADFSADSLKAYIVSKGNATMSVYSPAFPLQTVTLGAPANDVTFLSQGSLAYLAGGAGNSITARATCNNSALTNPVATAATPLLIASNFDSSRVFSVDGSNMYDVAVSNISLPATASCPPTASNTLNTVAFGSTFTPNRMILTSNGSRVFVTNNTNKVMVYNATNSTASSITLLNGGTATTTGGATLDSAQVYVGALGSNDVHRIDVAAGTDAQQIAVSLKDAASATVSPDFVVVRPK